MQIKAAIPTPPAKINGGKALVETFNVNIPDTIEGMVKMFGQEACKDMLKKGFVIAYQAFARGKMVKTEQVDGKATVTGIGAKGAALQALVDEYKPTVRKAGKSFLDKFRDKAKSMSSEDKAALLAELQGSGAPTGKAPIRRPAAPSRRPAA